MTFASPVSNLRDLLGVLTRSVDVIEASATAKGLSYPSLDAPLDASNPSEKLLVDPEVAQASMVGAAAAAHLFATLKNSGMTLFDRACSFQVSSALRVASEAGISELLRENPMGLHANAIGKITGTDPKHISRIMRLLATHFVFREIAPDVFVNNRISSLMDTGKSSATLLELMRAHWKGHNGDSRLNNVQAEKYAGASGLASIIEHVGDEGMKSSAYLAEYVLGGSDKVPFQQAYAWSGNFFDFMDGAGREGYLARTQAAYETSGRVESVTAILDGFNWRALEEGALVVDVGGGTGSLTLCITEHAPQLKMIVEDRAVVIDGVTRPKWANDPKTKGYLDSGRVSLQAHDFFQPQPSTIAGKPDIFLLRYIIHDWPDAQAHTILAQLHAAAPAHGRLLIVDNIIPYACPAPDFGNDIQFITSGSALNVKTPPSPLLPNFGMASTRVYYADMMMANLLGAQERTLIHFIELFGAAGWRIVKVYSPSESDLKHIECVKI